jgi:hypothetical protein
MDTLDTSRTIEIEASLWKMAGVAVLGVIMTVAPLAFALHWIEPETLRHGTEATFFAAAGFFGLCTLAIVWRLFTASGPVVSIGPQGIRDKRVAAETIPWAAIIDIGTWTYRGQHVLVLKVSSAAERKLSLTKIARFTRAANKALGADGLCIAAAGLKISYDDLFETVAAYANAARTRDAG